MKRLFGVVFALNIVLFVTILFFDSPSSSRAPAVKADNRSDHTLLLLSEQSLQPPSTPAHGPITTLPSVPAAEAAVSPEGPCFALGPFPRPEDAISAVMQLKARNLDARARKKDEQTAAGYLAFIAPSNTRAEARTMLRKLHQQGIDSFIVTQGDKNNAISVGIYSEFAQAQARQAELRAKGYEIIVEPRGTLKREHWVDVAGKQGINVVSEIEKSFSTDFASLRLERQECR